MTEELELLQKLGLALAIGVLVGVERGHHARKAEEGERTAGVRTFSLMGLLGGLWGHFVAATDQTALLGFGFLGFTALVIAGHVLRARALHLYGITTEVAALLVFVLGALAAVGEMLVAAVGGVVAMTLLSVKPVLHDWVERLDRRELWATARLLVVTVVILPVLPDQSYGPAGGVNPYQLWWLVVLVGAVSFVGYFAVRIAGARVGTVATALFAGLASSTAATLHFARQSRDGAPPALLACGVGLSSAVMAPRVLAILAVVSWPLAKLAAAPLLALGATGAACALMVGWRSIRADGAAADLPLKNPFELTSACKFAALLAAIALGARLLEQAAGTQGLYALAAATGLADAAALALSVAEMSRNDTTLTVAVTAITLNVWVNTAVKPALAVVAGARNRAWAGRVALATLPAVPVSAAVLYWA